MNFKFSNLLGAPYRGGNFVLSDQELLSPVGNRVSQVNLAHSTSTTFPFENLKQVRIIAVSPNGALMLSIDEDGRALLINKARRALLHHFSFKGSVQAAVFSPDGAYVAVAVGKLLQVWRTPGFEKQMSPMQLHRTYGGCHADITRIDWSACGRFMAVASKDLTARVFSLDPIPGYQPATLSGHKDAPVAVFFTGAATWTAAELAGQEVPHMYTVSKDGALYGWTYKRTAAGAAGAAGAAAAGAAADSDADEQQPEASTSAPSTMDYSGGSWSLAHKHYFNQRGAKVSACDFHRATGLLVVGYSNGLFDLHQLPDFSNIHTLSISRERITAMCFNQGGDWIAIGCAKLGQLLVWEWRSETYVLKQQGHYFDVATAAFSPDGALVATGADDCKVKVFQLSSGFCFVTFSEHTAPISAVRFLPSGHALLSASLDGTVRAYDLVRYRNFRTFTAPSAVQFGSLAVDPAGEIVCAGTVDTFQIYVWSMKTGRLLDILAGHEGPVSGLAFSPRQPLLASSSWDRTVRTWDVFDGKGAVEVLQHGHDVLALAFAPDGKHLASSTLDGQIYFWDALEGSLQGTIEGRRDIKGGRLAADRRSAGNLDSGACFTSLTYSADGSFLLAGGSSKFVCLYDVADRVMLRRFQITHNRSLDGVLDVLNSKNLTDAGPVDLINHDSADEDEELLPAGGDPAAAADVPGTAGKKRPVARSRAVCLAPTGRTWAAATTEGLLLYSVDDSLVFDPTDLTEDLTPAACHRALAAGAYVRALLISLRLKDQELLAHVVLVTPQAQTQTVAAALPRTFVPQMLTQLAELLASSPHVEFLLGWIKALCAVHSGQLQGGANGSLPSLRMLQKVLNRLHGDLAAACENNLYTLEYLTMAGAAAGEGAEGAVAMEVA